MRLKTIIIDDEQESLDVLRMELEHCCPQVDILDCIDNPFKAIEKIKLLQPDLIFLDIEMPGLNGFDLLNKLTNYNFDVIFVTAYDEFAIQAIKVSAMDYLLKPIDSEELMDAVHKVQEKIKHELAHEHVDILLTNLRDKSGEYSKLAIPDNEGIEFVSMRDILYCQSDGNYTRIFTEGDKYIVSKSLKHFEEILPEKFFFRTHQSFLVNLSYIKKYLRGSGGELILSNGAVIQVARAKKDALLQRIYKK